MSLPARIALPAVLANSWSQERALAELDTAARAKAQGVAAEKVEHVTVIPTRQGFLEFSSRLLEEKTIMRSTMKAPAAKSVLDGPVNVTQSSEVANEILNEMQRSHGGDVVEEAFVGTVPVRARQLVVGVLADLLRAKQVAVLRLSE